ncbi:hypothetical protein BFW38_03275 [Terasakiispira papahanaumokuakeensis]|uniref:Uncharacterized protein n=1 Tax=Terasakiispira papahanaumokuakeensis TaxID=197479 RepID=A0A1E2V6S1_9GAMM|nr:hypothetical protein BFW38_03275 [Terasakiispira papahanaumokuakeensis]
MVRGVWIRGQGRSYSCLGVVDTVEQAAQKAEWVNVTNPTKFTAAQAAWRFEWFGAFGFAAKAAPTKPSSISEACIPFAAKAALQLRGSCGRWGPFFAFKQAPTVGSGVGVRHHPLFVTNALMSIASRGRRGYAPSI